MDLETPLWFRDVCDKLEELVLELDREVSDWKDRFFFDALDAHEDDLCYECKENMRVAFYVSNDRSQALKWRPHGDWCSQKNCKYYKFDIFNDVFVPYPSWCLLSTTNGWRISSKWGTLPNPIEGTVIC